jgi:hypothetical protein
MPQHLWRWLMAIGVATPLVSLLFIEWWNPHAGVVRNLQRANVVLYESEAWDRACLARHGRIDPQTGLILPPLGWNQGTPYLGTGDPCEIERQIAVGWRWIAVAGVGLIAFGFVMRR